MQTTAMNRAEARRVGKFGCVFRGTVVGGCVAMIISPHRNMLSGVEWVCGGGGKMACFRWRRAVASFYADR